MHTEHEPVDPNVLAEMGYERRDVNTKPLIIGAAWLFACTIAVGVLSAIFIRIWRVVPEEEAKQAPFTQVRPPAGTPILQNNSDNTADIVELRSHEAERLSTSGDLKDEPGFHYIPLDSAIKIVSQRGLPTTGTATVTRPAVPTAAAATPPVATSTSAAVPDHRKPQVQPMVAQASQTAPQTKGGKQ